MTAPLHTLPFCLEHAKAGAPIATTFGCVAHLIAHVPEAQDYDRVVVRVNACVTTRNEAGEVRGSRSDSATLVMTPLGYLDGKPVFVGDELAMEGVDHKIVVAPTSTVAAIERCRWPAPAPVYPETRMGLDELAIAFNSVCNQGVLLVGCRAVANAAIRRAIEDGQVVLPTEDRAARDMAIAEAVRSACAEWTRGHFMFTNANLAAIIAGVKP